MDSHSASSTLSIYGAEIASKLNHRDTASALYEKDWDPDTNPDGIVNIGTAENVGRCFSSKR
jgi:hypothetical protein